MVPSVRKIIKLGLGRMRGQDPGEALWGDCYFTWGGYMYVRSQLVTEIKTHTNWRYLKKLTPINLSVRTWKLKLCYTTLILLKGFYVSIEMCFPLIIWPPTCSEFSWYYSSQMLCSHYFYLRELLWFASSYNHTTILSNRHTWHCTMWWWARYNSTNQQPSINWRENSFIQHLLSTCYMPSTVLSPGDIKITKIRAWGQGFQKKPKNKEKDNPARAVYGRSAQERHAVGDLSTHRGHPAPACTSEGDLETGGRANTVIFKTKAPEDINVMKRRNQRTKRVGRFWERNAMMKADRGRAGVGQGWWSLVQWWGFAPTLGRDITFTQACTLSKYARLGAGEATGKEAHLSSSIWETRHDSYSS